MQRILLLLFFSSLLCLHDVRASHASSSCTDQGANATNDECVDRDENCHVLIEDDECLKNPTWMLPNCRKSCGCLTCVDLDYENCKAWKDLGECEKNPSYMHKNCPLSCNTCSQFTLYEDYERKLRIERDQRERRKLFPEENCRDIVKECSERKEKGECESNPGWMIVYCGKTCNQCALMDSEVRCKPENIGEPGYVYKNAYEPGGMTRMFERLSKREDVEVLMQPPAGPWILKFKNFVKDDEAIAMLNQTLPELERSTDQGEINEFGVQEKITSEYRTSSNAWCQDACLDHPLISNLTSRISQLVDVPAVNFEAYQVLKYELGQKYGVHPDSGDEEWKELAGPRILTFFIYFSDVEEGGETNFDKLNLTVKPAKGDAILWPNMLDVDPPVIDERTTHQALPVLKGEKLAANVWIHFRDFATPHLWGCTGLWPVSDDELLDPADTMNGDAQEEEEEEEYEEEEM